LLGCASLCSHPSLGHTVPGGAEHQNREWLRFSENYIYVVFSKWHG
jgi:hypothetical protein